jgi:hypothetical protein
MADSDPATRLEHHLAREFVGQYINRALTHRKIVAIDPNAIYLAARFSGLQLRSETLRKVLAEYRQPARRQ